ncbi:MAG TPA: PaaI family thioesterase [Spirochaetota bacterium]|nr:PaaI family thioesterase [Spirochaetota bacterium]HNT09496.1 PaaI family thioesterase [Spirochaetota bacterium]
MNTTVEQSIGELLPVQTAVPLCYVCGRENPAGLKLRFTKDSDSAISTEFTPPTEWTGWGSMLHGGFHGLLLDEVMAWVAWGLMDVRGFVTREMSVRYRKPAYVGQPLKIIGMLVEDQGRDMLVRGEIRDENGTLLTESSGVIRRIAIDSLLNPS